MRFQKTSIVAAATLASTVTAHGYVDKLTIAGTEYTVRLPPLSPHICVQKLTPLAIGIPAILGPVLPNPTATHRARGSRQRTCTGLDQH